VVSVVLAAWLLLFGMWGACAVAVTDAPPVVRMLAFVFTTLIGLKIVVLAAAAADGAPRLPFGRLLCFLAWFGMNPRTFARRRTPDRERARRWLRLGGGYLVVGVALALLAIAIGGTAGGVVWMLALSFVVHFGVFTLFAALLRAIGFKVPLLFDAPWRAATAAEFWALRWNHGFTEMTALVVQRPLAPRLGRDRALLVSFLVSGLLHEVVLSLPVRAGFGLPTLYFVIQGAFVLWQRDRRGRLATILAVVVPVPLLFHPWFVHGVAVPMVAALTR
jgi:hypothetical protein